jgi:hypothetical protein
LLREACVPVSWERVTDANRRHSAHLKLDSLQRDARSKLQPDHRFELIGVKKIRNEQALLEANRVTDRWNRIGRTELVRAARALRRELDRAVLDNSGEYLQAVAAAAPSAPELAAILRETLASLEERKSRLCQELERLGAHDFGAAVRAAEESLESRWSGRAAREKLVRKIGQWIRVQCEVEGLKAYLEGYLEPLRKRISDELERVETLARELELVSRQLELQMPVLSEAIGYENSYYLEIVDLATLPHVLVRMERDIPARMGEPDKLQLSQLLMLGSGGSLKDLLEEAGSSIQSQVMEFFHHYVKDLQGFIDYFQLDFDLRQWLDGALEITLPAKLDLGARGPGNTPMQTYLVGPSAMKKAVMQLVLETGNQLGVEYCEAENPFEVILRAKISRAPFRSIPGLVRLERAYQRFNQAAPKDHICGRLITLDCLNKALELDFWAASDDAVVGDPAGLSPRHSLSEAR